MCVTVRCIYFLTVLLNFEAVLSFVFNFIWWTCVRLCDLTIHIYMRPFPFLTRSSWSWSYGCRNYNRCLLPLQLLVRIQLMASYTSHVSPVLSGIRFAQSLVLCVVFSRSFSFGHCYGFCLPLWYLQTLPNPFLAIFITMFKNE